MGFKFSIQQMLLGMIGVATICALLGGWANDSAIAYGLTVSILGSVFAFLIFGAIYWLSLPASYLFRRNGKTPTQKRNRNSVKVASTEPTAEATGQ